MILTDWMRVFYDAAIGERIADVLRAAKNDGIRVRHEAQIQNAFNAETKRRAEVMAKFRKIREAA